MPNNGIGGEKITKNDQTDVKAKRSRVSSEYVRVVGDAKIEVVNTKQRTDVPKSAKKKWAVVVRTPTKSGSVKTRVHAQCDKKSDAIKSLLVEEIRLKAEQ